MEFLFNDPATPEIYTLSQHGALPISPQPNAPEPLYPDTTFTHRWSGDVGDERIVARHHGRGHTSGDAVITFERANVAHLGDRSEEHTSELQSRQYLVCRLLLEKIKLQ